MRYSELFEWNRDEWETSLYVPIKFRLDDYTVTLDDEASPQIATLFYKDKSVGKLAMSGRVKLGDKRYLKIGMVEIDPQHRGKGLSKYLYKAFLENNDAYSGLVSHAPDSVNKKQIPSLHKSFNTYSNGDWIILPKIITEAPISDISYRHEELNGNFNTGTSFDDREKKLIQSPDYKKRIVKAFQKTPHNFELIFMSLDNVDYKDNLSSVMDHFGIYKEFKDIKGEAGKIKVVLISNISDTDRIPLTPWIIAHKIGHGLEDGFVARENWDVLDKLISDVIMAGNPDDDQIFSAFTFKSARNGTVLSGEEATVECVAQYLITGKVTLTEPFKKFEASINSVIEKMFEMIEGKVIVEG